MFKLLDDSGETNKVYNRLYDFDLMVFKVNSHFKLDRIIPNRVEFGNNAFTFKSEQGDLYLEIKLENSSRVITAYKWDKKLFKLEVGFKKFDVVDYSSEEMGLKDIDLCLYEIESYIKPYYQEYSNNGFRVQRTFATAVI